MDRLWRKIMKNAKDTPQVKSAHVLFRFLNTTENVSYSTKSFLYDSLGDLTLLLGSRGDTSVDFATAQAVLATLKILD